MLPEGLRREPRFLAAIRFFLVGIGNVSARSKLVGGDPRLAALRKKVGLPEENAELSLEAHPQSELKRARPARPKTCVARLVGCPKAALVRSPL